MPHLVATLIYLSQNYSYYIRGDRSPLRLFMFLLFSLFPADCYHTADDGDSESVSNAGLVHPFQCGDRFLTSDSEVRSLSPH